MAKDTQLSRVGFEPGQFSSRGNECNPRIKLYKLYKSNCIQLLFLCHWEPAEYLGHSVPSARTPGLTDEAAVCVLTRGWRCVQVHILTVLSIASRVAATDTQHIHRACVRVLKKGAGAPHLLPTLPACRAWLGRDVCTPEFNSVMPGRW